MLKCTKNTDNSGITLYNVCVCVYVQYRRGVQYHVGVQYRGDIMSTVGGYHEYRGGYLEYHGVFSTVGDIMINVGDIMSTMGVFSTVGLS